MLEAIQNAMRLPDLRRKILFTLFILVVYRLAAHIPVPGVNLDALEQVFSPSNTSATSGLLGVLDIFSGGALSNFSVVAMGVYPYITASIIIQLITPLIPQLTALQKEGDQGRRQLNRYTHWLTIPLALLQGMGQASIMANTSPPVLPGFNMLNIVNPLAPQFISTWAILISMTAGTMFALWLGELISEQGIGSGVSIIIFGGIVAAIPSRVFQLATTNIPALFIFIAITIVTVVGVVYLQEGQRRIPVQYGKRQRGMRIYGGGSTYIPLRVNAAGMIPLIFALSILIFPGLIAAFFQNSSIEWLRNFATTIVQLFDQRGWLYAVTYFAMVIVFTFFYTFIVFQQQNLSETLQNQGGFIPGIRPGPQTTRYLNGVVMRITIIGALGLGIIALLPFLERFISGTDTQTFIVSSTGLLIVVGVVLDTMKQLEAQLMMRHYEGFIK
ncbi:MAG: preprotein translocase subunit SecY [Chloroflexi bacterium UTCFX4]|jgi:preprotein translocase subunit SecY|nr:MAG: preprotein translocase subunit SecY [Chloroflexi bacterium UTCFX4]